jgi:hypothetical protein
MANEYHNYVDVLGEEKDRQAFLAAALTKGINWFWVKIDFNSEAHKGGDSGKSKLDFYSRNFPQGLDVLMEEFPGLTLDGLYIDYSGGVAYKMKTKSNVILEESEESLEQEG